MHVRYFARYYPPQVLDNVTCRSTWPQTLLRSSTCRKTKPNQDSDCAPCASLGAHSDYGMLTILATDDVPGLQIHAATPAAALASAPQAAASVVDNGTSNAAAVSASTSSCGWQNVAPIPGTFIINLGDMLEVGQGLDWVGARAWVQRDECWVALACGAEAVDHQP